MRAVLALALLLTAGGTVLAGEAWWETYEKAVLRIDDGSYPEAVELLKACLAERPQEEARVRTQGVRYVDYLPHLYLGVAYTEMGKKELAAEHFDLSERAGAVEASEEGIALLKKYRLRLTNAQVLAPPARAPASPIAEQEYKQIEMQVLDRCHLQRGKAPEVYPWYFHYELGLELLKHDDPSRALTSLLVALEKRDKPQRFTRTYGMWYLTYAPYLSIGVAHYRLGNYDCAKDALQMSDALEELQPSDPSYTDREELRRQVRNERPK